MILQRVFRHGSRLGRILLPLGVGMITYQGVFSLPWLSADGLHAGGLLADRLLADRLLAGGWIGGIAVVLASLGPCLDAPFCRATLYLILGCALSLIGVGHMLGLAWGVPTYQLGVLSTALAWGGAACGICWQVLRFLSMGRLGWGLALMGLALMGLGAGVPLLGKGALRLRPVPAWQNVLASLGPAPRGDQVLRGDVPWVALDRLHAAGLKDASDAWVGLALSQNADPPGMRSHCIKAGKIPLFSPFSSLSQAWQPWIQLGRLACQAMTAWPEQGAQMLRGRSEDATLRRLQGDLLMEAGRVASALEAYHRADPADVFARADALVACGMRHRLEAFQRVFNAQDPWSRLWLAPQAHDLKQWAAWNQAMDVGTLAGPRRRGLQAVGAPGTLEMVWDVSLARLVMVTRSAYGGDFGVALPMPPAGGMPSQIRLLIKKRQDVQLVVVGATGQKLTYGCASNPSAFADVQRFPEDLCRGQWTEALLILPKDLKGPLKKMVLMGNFALAWLKVQP